MTLKRTLYQNLHTGVEMSVDIVRLFLLYKDYLLSKLPCSAHINVLIAETTISPKSYFPQ